MGKLSYFKQKGARLAAAALVASSSLAGGLAPAGTAAADGYGGASVRELLSCAAPWNYNDCRVAQDAMNWSYSITNWKFPGGSGHNNMADAFRHCTWTGAMSQRLGMTRASGIATAHENKEGQPLNEKQMDLNNNTIGVAVGNSSNVQGGSDKWGWIMNTCERYARNRQLFGLGGIRGSY